MSGRLLAVRLDNAGDVLLAGPALRAMRSGADELVLLAGPHGAAAAQLLPGVDDVLVWTCPWIDGTPVPVDADDIHEVVDLVKRYRFDAALVFTSFHQSALPTALLLRLAGIDWVGAISDDYPGSLLDLRHRVAEHLPEAERALSLAYAAGYDLPRGDDGTLAIRQPLPRVEQLPSAPFVVLHPGTSVPARAWPVHRFAETAALLCDQGYDVVVTGSPGEVGLTATVAAAHPAVTDLGGATSMAELASVLAAADVVVVANTGPAHLAAAVGASVVSLFAPTVPAVKWAPYRVPHVLLGDQQAACRDSRATVCPVPDHPCLTSVSAGDVVQAVGSLSRPRRVDADVRPATTNGAR